MTRRIIFCLGSNLGNRKLYLEKAQNLLQEKLQLKHLKKSSILENKALLLPNSPADWNMDFYNMAISGDINLEKFSPMEILQITQQIECEVGKIYRGKWSPREIDIDIAIIEDLKISNKNLQIPHSQLFARDFFLQNISEIEPEILKKSKNNP